VRVRRVGYPCAVVRFPAAVTKLAQDSPAGVDQVQAGASGYFRVVLVPGQYILDPNSRGILPRASEVALEVQAQQFARREITRDSGIR
jgi:hypothetical protein